MRRLKFLTPIAIATIPLQLFVTSCGDVKPIDVYRNINLDDNWTFRLNSDEEKQTINLPHDFSIIQDFKHTKRQLEDRESSGTTGFLPGGVGHYHKDFILPKKDNASIILNFDGAYNDTTVTVNNQIVGNNKYGYNPFAFDISKYVVADGKTENHLDVVVRHDFVTSSRWYPGSGIYRDVKVSVLDKLHIANNGTYVTTPNLKEEVGKNVTVNVEAEVQNSYDEAKVAYVRNRVVDANGEPVTSWTSTKSQKIGANTSINFNGTLKVNDPLLWSAETPNLYYVETQVVLDKTIVDQYKTRFGFRYFDFKREGFSVNGKVIKLQGVCLHHDQGALGAAAYNDAIYRQLTKMKEMGMNAVRTSHNCPDEDFLRMCDELGLYVMDEAFDGWEFAKTQNDFSKVWKDEIGAGNQLIDATPDMQWHSFVMRSMVKRDRNCPSIFMWSLGNELHEGAYHDDIPEEEKERISDEMVGYAKELKSIAEELDHDENTKRWCGTALENDPLDPSKVKSPKTRVAMTLYNEHGLLGFNYGEKERTEEALKEFDRVYGSETASAQNSRGMYSKIQFDSEDEYHRVPSVDAQGTTTASDVIWRTEYFDGYGGQFVWTGFDYIGEPSPWCWNCEDDPVEKVLSHWPNYPNSSYYGIVDTCGFEKDSYYLYRAHLRKDDTTLHLVGSLNEDNMYVYPNGTDFPEGYTPIDIYTNAPYVLIEDQNGNDIAKVTRYDTEKTSRGEGTYYTYIANAIDTSICQIKDTEVKKTKGYDMYANILVNPTGITEIKATAYKDADFNDPIEDTVGLSSLQPKDASRMRIKAKADKTTLKADGKSLSYITIDLEDANGNLITDWNSQQEVEISWTGAGKVLGVDNGNPSTTEKWQNPAIFHPDTKKARIMTYAGKALIIVCSDITPGTLKVLINDNPLPIEVI